MADKNDTFNPADFGLDETDLGDAEAQTPAKTEGGEMPRMGAAHDPGSHGVDLARMKMVLDVPLKVTVELGRTKLLINDLLQLGQGSVVELDKMAGEPMEIYVNDKLIALGEVVVVNEKFGVRLTDIMNNVGMEDSAPKEVA